MKEIKLYILIALSLCACNSSGNKVEQIFSVDSEYVIKLLPPPPPSPPIEDSRIIRIKATQDDKVLLNGKIVSQKEMAQQLKSFIKKQPDEHFLISLQTDRGTSYTFYLEVRKRIVSVYSELRNEKSIELFNKPFDELSDDEKRIIREIYPQNISEADPNESAKHS